ncbi:MULTISPECIES: ABC transporter ATP-binding protein [Paenibacillus]|uniref:ABC transporter ATP-binding protein n=1 Tax=Paenibacillus naphthalenovorans TaxID=162209 RepID=A0A0U2MVZ5_9BACL|nr:MULTISPECIES: ABC transporter ATP-binding protein [Paenibacillus]ALS21951.1 ABC transporter ATP-binding protein [Paenibacillus naphthalenovorans]GCL74164.1 ABC transporter ATP-binding protein [Paenibacillus naphthalenovorans]
MNGIELRNVSKSFKGLSLFENVSVSFEKGKIYGIVGHNGSGKSVLFKMMCGFVFPDQGSVLVNGIELGKNKRFPENFGIIIDKPGYLGDKTGFENLKYLAAIQNKISDEKIKETLEMVGLQYTLKQKVKHYSLGMKQKLAIAQAIMEDQDVLLLDEPFNGLDVDSVENIRNLLKSLNQEGKTIILTSHHNEDIELLCEHVFRVRNCTLEQLK